LGGRGRRISEFEASLVYRVSFRTARAAQRNPVSKNQEKKNKRNESQEGWLENVGLLEGDWFRLSKRRRKSKRRRR
jgi:hypothetical protein